MEIESFLDEKLLKIVAVAGVTSGSLYSYYYQLLLSIYIIQFFLIAATVLRNGSLNFNLN